jgi:8-oxo-dGTP pyrophosphatase MutT (NUDIX family)
MITFDEGNLRFNYRIVGIAMDNDRVLLQKVEGQDFWALPGGRGEFLEPAIQTLKREMQEELGIEVEVGRLVWVVENFFTGNEFITGEEMSYHELGLYFLMELLDRSSLRSLSEFYGEDESFKITFKWYPLNELENIVIYPSFLRTGLNNIPETTEHILHTDENTPGRE